jgi:hypothetical protein
MAGESGGRMTDTDTTLRRGLEGCADAVAAIRELVAERDQARAELAAERHHSEQLASDLERKRAQVARIANQWAQFKQRFAILDAVMPLPPAVPAAAPAERPKMLEHIREDIADMAAGRGGNGAMRRNPLFATLGKEAFAVPESSPHGEDSAADGVREGAILSVEPPRLSSEVPKND